jgi:ketosteroid isomerase-like protein
MRVSAVLAVPAILVGLATGPAFAQAVDPQLRQQIEAVHTKWVDALNAGDLAAFATLYTPATIGVDAFGRQQGVNPDLLQALHRKGISISMPVEGVQALTGGQAAIAYGAFTTRYADPNLPVGQGNWVQVFERDGDAWKIRVVASSRSALAAQLK